MGIQLPDARQLSEEALEVIRLRALRGIELGYTEVELADLLGVNNETISRWWSAFSTDGLAALPHGHRGRPLGSGRFLSEQQAQRIRECIDFSSPEQLGIPHALWTRRAVRDLIRQECDVDLAERTVGEYLRRWGYTSKKPSRRARKQDPDEVEQWLLETYPAIEAQAEQQDAEILWTDEVGVAADHHPGCGYARIGERATMEVLPRQQRCASRTGFLARPDGLGRPSYLINFVAGVIPGPHIRVNQISAISNEGTVRFMTYKGMLNAATFLLFLSKLILEAPRKILLIADRLQAHRTPEVQAWLEDNSAQIEVFYLPGYSPELNPTEYLNNDLKGRVNEAGLAGDRETLKGRILGFMRHLGQVPSHVISYFLHPWTQYAAPVELV